MPLIETYYKEFPSENIVKNWILSWVRPFDKEFPGKFYCEEILQGFSWCTRYSPWKISGRNWISWKNVLGQNFHWKYFPVEFPVSMSWSYLSVRDFPKNISEIMNFPKVYPQWELSVRNFLGEISVRNSVGMYRVWTSIRKYPSGQVYFLWCPW